MFEQLLADLVVPRHGLGAVVAVDESERLEPPALLVSKRDSNRRPSFRHWGSQLSFRTLHSTVPPKCMRPPNTQQKS